MGFTGLRAFKRVPGLEGFKTLETSRVLRGLGPSEVLSKEFRAIGLRTSSCFAGLRALKGLCSLRRVKSPQRPWRLRAFKGV